MFTNVNSTFWLCDLGNRDLGTRGVDCRFGLKTARPGQRDDSKC